VLPVLRRWLRAFSLLDGLGTCGWLIGSGRFGGALTRNIRMLIR
jgi:hypothetical protein